MKSKMPFQYPRPYPGMNHRIGPDDARHVSVRPGRGNGRPCTQNEPKKERGDEDGRSKTIPHVVPVAHSFRHPAGTRSQQHQQKERGNRLAPRGDGAVLQVDKDFSITILIILPQEVTVGRTDMVLAGNTRIEPYAPTGLQQAVIQFIVLIA